MFIYILKRLSPFLAVFLVMQVLLRITLSIREYEFLDGNVATFLKMLALGAVYDIEVFSFIAIPALIYLIILPAKMHGKRLDRVLTDMGWFVFTSCLIFDFIAENIFWTEFTSRFNFIAVDYLVYTNEVIGNIAESYPLWIIFPGIATGALFLTYFFRRSMVSNPPKKFSTKWKVITLAAALIVPASLYVAVDMGISKISNNQYINDIATNGIYDILWAYHHNEINYENFYLTNDASQVSKNMKVLLTEVDEDSEFLNDNPEDITRIIRNAEPEIHKNVILVVMESMSANYMEHFGNKDRLTPNLDSLADQSIFFTKFYATGTRTVRGLEAVALSVPPTPGQSIIRRPGNENLFSLGFVFKDRGYDTRFIYGGYGYFDNMSYFFENNGFDSVDRTKFSPEEISFSNVWGVCDEDLFHKVVKEADESYKNKKPFMQLVMTTSNHRPYTYPDGRIDIPSHKGRDGGVKYADYAVGKLIEEAKTKPWFNDTVFIFVADHTAGSAGKIELDPEKYHIPLMIYSPSFLEPTKFNEIASQIDVSPVLLGLLKFSYYSKFYGEDILHDEDEVPHAFISSYQKVGFIRDGQLTVLEPKNGVEVFEGDEIVDKDKIKPSTLFDTVTYYQYASGWKERMKRIDTVIK